MKVSALAMCKWTGAMKIREHQSMMSDAIQNCHRVLLSNGILHHLGNLWSHTATATLDIIHRLRCQVLQHHRYSPHLASSCGKMLYKDTDLGMTTKLKRWCISGWRHNKNILFRWNKEAGTMAWEVHWVGEWLCRKTTWFASSIEFYIYQIYCYSLKHSHGKNTIH